MPLPTWLRRWAATILAYIEEEAAALLPLLHEARTGGTRRGGKAAVAAAADAAEEGGQDSEREEMEEDGHGREQALGGGGSAAMSAADADVASEVAHLRKARVQALAFALDKAKLFLRHQVSLGPWKLRLGCKRWPMLWIRVLDRAKLFLRHQVASLVGVWAGLCLVCLFCGCFLACSFLPCLPACRTSCFPARFCLPHLLTAPLACLLCRRMVVGRARRPCACCRNGQLCSSCGREMTR